MWIRILILALSLLVSGSLTAAQSEGGEIAVITHPEVPVEDLEIKEIRRILLGERQFWSPNLRVTLLIRAPVARERDIILKKLYRMSENQFRQYWIGKVFRAETQSGPKIVYSTDMAGQLVQALPGSISFVRASDAPAGVKILLIDGKKPGDDGYPLK